jgi:hypothetical protein
VGQAFSWEKFDADSGFGPEKTVSYQLFDYESSGGAG